MSLADHDYIRDTIYLLNEPFHHNFTNGLDIKHMNFPFQTQALSGSLYVASANICIWALNTIPFSTNTKLPEHCLITVVIWTEAIVCIGFYFHTGIPNL